MIAALRVAVAACLCCALVACSRESAESPRQRPVDTTLPEEPELETLEPVQDPYVPGPELETEAPSEPEGELQAPSETAAPEYLPRVPEAVPAPVEVTNPDWSRRPSEDDMSRYYPDRALRMEMEGRATLSCQVNARGSLETCAVVQEAPSDMGFGDAAMKLSRLYRMRPHTLDGHRVEGGVVRIPIAFRLPRQ